MVKPRSTYDHYLDRFFQHLEKRDFTGTDQALASMQDAAAENPDYRLWIRYFQGILAAERDRDWAESTDGFRRLLAGPLPDELRAQTHLSLAIAYDNHARWQEAIQAAEMSAQLWGDLKRPLRRAVALRQIAISRFRGFETGEHDIKVLEIAHANCLEAVALLESVTVTEDDVRLYRFDRPRYTALTYEVLGIVLTGMGQYSQAEQAHQSRLEVAKHMGDSYDIGIAQMYLADIRQLSLAPDWPTTVGLYDQAWAILYEEEDELNQFLLLASKGRCYQRHGMPKNAVDCFRQSLMLVESIRSGISSENARHGFFSTAVNIHDNALLAALELQDLDTAFESAEYSRSRTLQEKLVLSGIQLPDEQDAFKSLGQVQSLLRQDEALLEYHCTGLLAHYGGPSTEFQAKNNVLYPEPHIVLFVVTSTETAVFDLGFSPNTLLANDHTQLATGLFLSPHLRRALYDRLLMPAETLLADRQRVYIVPHGPLHHVPFHALNREDETTLLHKNGPEIVYAPSSSVLFRDMPNVQGQSGPACLAIGFNGDGANVLRFAEAEADHVAKITGGQALFGKVQKKATLFKNAPGYDLLHFSCHGHFDFETPLASCLYTGQDETLTGQEIIENLHLNQAVVVLSACESGINRIRRGDELYGLVRAFLHAGASAIVASMWRVDERAAILFFDEFYRTIQAGASVAASVKQAQIYLQMLTRNDTTRLLEDHLSDAGDGQRTQILVGLDHGDRPFADPVHWASFIPIGDSHISG